MDDSFFKFFVCSAEPGAVVPKRAPSNHLICIRCVHRHLVVDRFSSISRLISQQNMQISGWGGGGGGCRDDCNWIKLKVDYLSEESSLEVGGACTAIDDVLR